MSDIQNYMQILSIFIILYSLWILHRWTRRDKNRYQWSVPIIVFLWHNLIYYVYIQLANILPLVNGFFGFWGTVVRFHGLVTIALIAYALERLNGRLGNITVNFTVKENNDGDLP